jgi:hypothetical protein
MAKTKQISSSTTPAPRTDNISKTAAPEVEEDPQPIPSTPGEPRKPAPTSRTDDKPKTAAPEAGKDSQPIAGTPPAQMSKTGSSQGAATSSEVELITITREVPKQPKKGWLTWLKEKIFGKPKLQVEVTATPISMSTTPSSQRKDPRQASQTSAQTKSNPDLIDKSGKRMADKMTHDTTYGSTFNGSPTVAGTSQRKTTVKGR